MTAHLSEEPFDFFEEREHHNDRPWFAGHEDTDERELTALMLDVVAAVNVPVALATPIPVTVQVSR